MKWSFILLFCECLIPQASNQNFSIIFSGTDTNNSTASIKSVISWWKLVNGRTAETDNISSVRLYCKFLSLLIVMLSRKVFFFFNSFYVWVHMLLKWISCRHVWKCFCKEWLMLCSIETHFDALTTDSFWKHCGRRRNCLWQAISSFPAMFSSQRDNCISICPLFWHHIYLLLNWKSPKWPYEVKGLQELRQIQCLLYTGHSIVGSRSCGL